MRAHQDPGCVLTSLGKGAFPAGVGAAKVGCLLPALQPLLAVPALKVAHARCSSPLPPLKRRCCCTALPHVHGAYPPPDFPPQNAGAAVQLRFAHAESHALHPGPSGELGVVGGGDGAPRPGGRVAHAAVVSCAAGYEWGGGRGGRQAVCAVGAGNL